MLSGLPCSNTILLTGTVDFMFWAMVLSGSMLQSGIECMAIDQYWFYI